MACRAAACWRSVTAANDVRATARRRPTAAPAAARLPPPRRRAAADRPLVACSAAAAVAPQPPLDASIRRMMLDATGPLDPATVRCGEAPSGPWERLSPAEQRWLDNEVEQLAAAPSTAPGADASAQLSLPGVADAAVITRIGRVYPGMWKYRNQDAFVAAAAGPAALLLAVFDGHNTGGERASAAAAASVAAAFAERPLPGSASHAEQQAAAVAALQRAAAELRAASGYERCGAAAAVCLAAPGCLTAAWAGDCRAVAGVCMGDGSLQPLNLTQDHKPDSPLERARIEATPHGRVKQTPGGGARLLDGSLCWQEAMHAKTLGLARALGDTAYTPLGLSSEPDAATLRLPPAPAGRRHVLVVASDGLWEVVGSAEAVAAAAAAGTPTAAAAALADLARRRGVACRGGHVLDDCTVAVAFVA